MPTSTVCSDKLKTIKIHHVRFSNIVLVHHYYVLIHQPTFMHLSIHTLNPTSFKSVQSNYIVLALATSGAVSLSNASSSVTFATLVYPREED